MHQCTVAFSNLKLIRMLGVITNYCLCVFTEYHNSLLCGLLETGVTVCFGKRALCMPSRAVPSQSLIDKLTFHLQNVLLGTFLKKTLHKFIISIENTGHSIFSHMAVVKSLQNVQNAVERCVITARSHAGACCGIATIVLRAHLWQIFWQLLNQAPAPFS